MSKYVIERCRCQSRNCPDWHVPPVAAIQGVGFTEKQATAVAAVLNATEDKDPRAGALALIKWTRDQVGDVEPKQDWTNEVLDRLDAASDALEFEEEFRS